MGTVVVTGGKAPAIVPPGIFGGGAVVVAVGRVKFVVVSTFVAVVEGGAISPGALIVELAGACPSGTTSYCC